MLDTHIFSGGYRKRGAPWVLALAATAQPCYSVAIALEIIWSVCNHFVFCALSHSREFFITATIHQ